MKKLVVIGELGEEIIIEVGDESTLMEALRDNGFDDLLALCGGCCSCATCHVQIDDAFADQLPEMDQEERGLLEFSEGFIEGKSRLSCQINVADVPDDLRLTISPQV